jgi:hypothetical protein
MVVAKAKLYVLNSPPPALSILFGGFRSGCLLINAKCGIICELFLGEFR